MLLRFPCARASRWLVTLTACLVSVVLVHGHAAEQGRPESGRILGHVRLGVRPSPRPLSTDAYSRQITTPDAPASEMSNVLVWIKDAPRAGTVPAVQAELHQRGEMFVPHVVSVTTGSTVTFPNDDALFHNVFSLSRAGTFDLGRYPQGDTRVRRFDKAGIIKVYCHLHSHMSAIIAVFDHPWFAQVAPDGSFAIDRVPAGRYLLTGWHERAGSADHAITIVSGAATRVELLVPIEP